jgi:hypothetical protein
MAQLLELSLEHNTVCTAPFYRQQLVDRMQALQTLDSKAITAEDRRLAGFVCKEQGLAKGERRQKDDRHGDTTSDGEDREDGARGHTTSEDGRGSEETEETEETDETEETPAPAPVPSGAEVESARVAKIRAVLCARSLLYTRAHAQDPGGQDSWARNLGT